MRKLATLAIITATLAASPEAIAASPAEDSPGFNWVTDGNGKRGIVTLDGTPMVVGPCKFQRLWLRGKIRYSVTFEGRTYKTLDRLKGDRLARTGDCD